jgi:hypothetical protein
MNVKTFEGKVRSKPKAVTSDGHSMMIGIKISRSGVKAILSRVRFVFTKPAVLVERAAVLEFPEQVLLNVPLLRYLWKIV